MRDLELNSGEHLEPKILGVDILNWYIATLSCVWNLLIWLQRCIDQGPRQETKDGSNRWKAWEENQIRHV